MRETEAKFLDGPQEDIPREEVVVVCPRTSKPEESLVEMDAWTRPAALLAAGCNMEQVIAADWRCHLLHHPCSMSPWVNSADVFGQLVSASEVNALKPPG